MLSAPSHTGKCGCGLNFPKVSRFVHALALIFLDCTGEKFREIPDILSEESLLRVSSSCKMLYRCASVCVCVSSSVPKSSSPFAADFNQLVF